MTPATAIALSGGIDSLVAAALLKAQGHRVIGLHFLTGYETENRGASQQAHSPVASDLEAYNRRHVEPLTRQLDIPIHVIDLRGIFQKHVVQYFIQAYASGKTPNPCLVCNPLIKFDILFQHAQKLGAQCIATGHYARIKRHRDGRLGLFRGKDTKKDQSYFLARLTEKQLATAVLPLGDHTKDQTRGMARDMGLVPVSTDESQDAMFY